MSETTTSLELPQLSLGRYLELLKRRRWQVIPVSLLGLLIGGVVAFLIPRYFVAQTRLEYYRLPAEAPFAGPSEDPYAFVVKNATLLIPRAVEETMRKLGWSEVLIADPYERQQRIREVEERVQVTDINPEERRTYASIAVQFRDRDGLRAATFLNELVATFMSQKLDEMRQSAVRQRNQASAEVREAGTVRDLLNHELSQLAIEHDFYRLFDPALQRDAVKQAAEVIERQKTQLVDLAGEIRQLQQQVDATQKELDTTHRTLEPGVGIAAQLPPGSPALLLYRFIEADRHSLEVVMGEAHRDRAVTLARLQRNEALLAELVGDAGAEVLNPKVEKLRQTHAELEAKLAAAIARRDALQTQIADGEERWRRQQDALDDFLSKQTAYGEQTDRVEEAQKKLQAAIAVQQQLDSVPPIKQIGQALVPRAPTEPSIVLVAIIGCALGLGLAIGLILLLDMVRGTLKTVDDVERALPVPVLGGISHLETIEERARASQSRRRASLVAGLFLAGAVVVVTTFYVAPHRLPSFALQLLSLVLGG